MRFKTFIFALIFFAVNGLGMVACLAQAHSACCPDSAGCSMQPSQIYSGFQPEFDLVGKDLWFCWLNVDFPAPKISRMIRLVPGYVPHLSLAFIRLNHPANAPPSA
jgi:hypothetical protein